MGSWQQNAALEKQGADNKSPRDQATVGAMDASCTSGNIWKQCLSGKGKKKYIIYYIYIYLSCIFSYFLP